MRLRHARAARAAIWARSVSKLPPDATFGLSVREAHYEASAARSFNPPAAHSRLGDGAVEAALRGTLVPSDSRRLQEALCRGWREQAAQVLQDGTGLLREFLPSPFHQEGWRYLRSEERRV